MLKFLTDQPGGRNNSPTQYGALTASYTEPWEQRGRESPLDRRCQRKLSARGGTELTFEGYIVICQVKGGKGHWVKKPLRPERRTQKQKRDTERQRNIDCKLSRQRRSHRERRRKQLTVS